MSSTTCPSSQSLPHRLSEKSFRRYEEVIANAVDAAPQIVTIDPKQFNLAATTITARLRDAILSYYKYNWSSTMIDRRKFADIYRWPGIVVSQRNDGNIIVGTPLSVAAEDVKPLTATANVEPTQLSINGNDPQCVEAVALLLSKQVLVGPITVINAITDYSYLEQQYEIGVVDNKNGTVTLL